MVSHDTEDDVAASSVPSCLPDADSADGCSWLRLHSCDVHVRWSSEIGGESCGSHGNTFIAGTRALA